MDAWRAHAACRGSHVALWFPEAQDHVGRDAALATCRRCPVRALIPQHRDRSEALRGDLVKIGEAAAQKSGSWA